MSRRPAPIGLDRAFEAGSAEFWRWSFAVAITGLAGATGLHWLSNSNGPATGGTTEAPPVIVEFVVETPVQQAEPEASQPSPSEPLPQNTRPPAEDQPTLSVDEAPSEAATEPAAEPETSAPEPVAEAAVTEMQSPAPEIAAIPEADLPIPLPRSRPERSEPAQASVEAVSLPTLPSPALQASRATTPPTMQRQQPAPQPSTKPVAPSSAAPTAATAPGPQNPAPAAPQVSAAAEQAWQGRVVSHLYRHRDYPSQAQRSRQEGVVTLRFRIDTSGRILSSQIARSSGHDLLDNAVISLISRASPVPAPPPGIAASKLSLVVPIEFKLR